MLLFFRDIFFNKNSFTPIPFDLQGWKFVCMFPRLMSRNCIFSFFEILIFRGDNHHANFWKKIFHLIQASPFDLQSWNLACMIQRSIPRKVFFIFWKFKFLWEIIDNVVFIFVLQFNIHLLKPTIFYLQSWNLMCMIPK